MEYINAFHFLSSRRTIGFSCENPISVSDILSYTILYPTEDIDLFTYVIAQMDSEYLRIRYSDKPKIEKK